MPDATLYRVGLTPAVAAADVVFSFVTRREARTKQQAIPAGGNATIVRPHSPRVGRFEIGFRGTDAATRASAAETSLALGALHYFTGSIAALNTWRWQATGPIEVERVHELGGIAWKVSVDFTETS